MDVPEPGDFFPPVQKVFLNQPPEFQGSSLSPVGWDGSQGTSPQREHERVGERVGTLELHPGSSVS